MSLSSHVYVHMKNMYWYCDIRFPQVAGIQFGFDPNKKPGARVIAKTVKVQGKILDKARRYLVAMKEYLTKVFLHTFPLLLFGKSVPP